jgi:two-component system, NarL family, sensor histidine kinase UhpB
MKGNLEVELRKLKHGDHICLIYENPVEQMSVVVPFIMDGLDRGERCLYIVDDRTIEEIVQAFEAAGVDVAQERQRGALRLVTSHDTYLQAGGFVPQAMIDLLRQAEAEALADGFSGLRMTGELTWSCGPAPGSDRLIEYEALLNHLPTYSKSVILCQYHHSRFGVPCIHDVLRTHSIAILGGHVFPNPYYEMPEIVSRKDQPEMTPEFRAKRVDWWIAQLKRASTAEQERERALEELRLTERRFAEAEQVAHIGCWERDLLTDEVTWSDELYRLFGRQADEVNLSYQQFLNFLLPQDVDRLRAVVGEAIRERRHFRCDYRITLADGRVRVLHGRGGVILNERGEPIRLVGTAQDVTEVRKAEQALQEYAARFQALSRRVLEVQEEERRHLARELHDEFGQILAIITMNLHAARDLAGDAALPRLDECAALVREAGERMRKLAIELRPHMLDLLGLEATLRWLAEQHQQRTGCEVQVVGHLLETPLSPELTITCFRVVQEALTNVVRHAKARHVWIELGQGDSDLDLVIRDDGVGFDVAHSQKQAARRGSLGLAGMAERVHLVGGTLQVESESGRGTRIRASFALSEPPEEPPGPQD